MNIEQFLKTKRKKKCGKEKPKITNKETEFFEKFGRLLRRKSYHESMEVEREEKMRAPTESMGFIF